MIYNKIKQYILLSMCVCVYVGVDNVNRFIREWDLSLLFH